ADVKKALQTFEVATPVGSIRFDERGDAVGVGFAMYQVTNGKYVEVK
ncbi:MAG: branched-chain amino acid ABC transporter substrate-binding protein, partial [Gammaproteobacteria bacterium]|nr:branched-chain amino acid ABC transporter substrate-binding protein [Gammaproteobacteria bacterium]